MRAVTTEQNVLGEGVRWDARRGELLRVDIAVGRVFRDRVADDGALLPVRDYGLPGTVGAIAPIAGDDGWLLAANRGFTHLAPDGSHAVIAEVSPEGTRMNDAACDSRGRLWAGSLADDHHAGGGALYRLDGSGRVEQMLDGLTIPNGIAWSLDGSTMYLVDSGPRVIHAFAFDADRAAISDARILVTVPEDVGSPDGLTVDAGGDLWVAVYGGGRVQRYSPGGALKAEFAVPAEQTTCCAFAGRSLNWLYVTTATEGWTDARRRAEPGAGLVYRVDTDAVGQPAAPYVPDQDWWRAVTGSHDRPTD
jgi:sugar lactone lactonase YvrE